MEGATERSLSAPSVRGWQSLPAYAALLPPCSRRPGATAWVGFCVAALLPRFLKSMLGKELTALEQRLAASVLSRTVVDGEARKQRQLPGMLLLLRDLWDFWGRARASA